MPDLTDTIETVAESPASVSSDVGSVTQQSIPDLIQADKYLKSSDGAATKSRGLRFTKLKPPGAVGGE